MCAVTAVASITGHNKLLHISIYQQTKIRYNIYTKIRRPVKFMINLMYSRFSPYQKMYNSLACIGGQAIMGSGIMGSFTDREHGAVFMQFSDIRKLYLYSVCARYLYMCAIHRSAL